MNSRYGCRSPEIPYCRNRRGPAQSVTRGNNHPPGNQNTDLVFPKTEGSFLSHKGESPHNAIATHGSGQNHCQ